MVLATSPRTKRYEESVFERVILRRIKYAQLLTASSGLEALLDAAPWR